MNEEELQLDNEEMSPDDAMAALALATHFSEQLQPQDTMEATVEGENGAGMPQGGTEMIETEEVAPEQETPNLDDFKAEYEGEMKSFKKDIQKMIKDEVGGLKKMIKDTLNEEES